MYTLREEIINNRYKVRTRKIGSDYDIVIEDLENKDIRNSMEIYFAKDTKYNIIFRVKIKTFTIPSTLCTWSIIYSIAKQTNSNVKPKIYKDICKINFPLEHNNQEEFVLVVYSMTIEALKKYSVENNN